MPVESVPATLQDSWHPSLRTTSPQLEDVGSSQNWDYRGNHRKSVPSAGCFQLFAVPDREAAKRVSMAEGEGSGPDGERNGAVRMMLFWMRKEDDPIVYFLVNSGDGCSMSLCQLYATKYI